MRSSTRAIWRPDLVDVGLLAAVPLPLAPESRMLVAQIRDRSTHLAVDTPAIACLRARHLLAAVPAENKDAAHVSFRSVNVAALKSRRRSGAIWNTESGRPAAAHTTS